MQKLDMSLFRGECICGKSHQLAVEEIYLEAGALKRFPEILKNERYAKYHKFAVICDENTYEAAGRQVEKMLGGIPVVQLESEGLHADEIGVEKTACGLDGVGEVDCLLAVGSGTIHDLTRYLAYQKRIPFISIPTAASVDGFVSTTAAMSWYGFKNSMQAVAPILVVADSNILAAAPMRLTASGVGDLLGKYTALADWQIAHLLTGEYICQRICDMEYTALENLKQSLAGLERGEIDAYEKLMYGLLLSGLAMQMANQSRPASGAEHQLAHFWEMAVIHDHIDAYHGEKVGVGLLLVSDIYHKALSYLKNGDFKISSHVEVETGLIEKAFENPDLRSRIMETNTPNPLTAIDPARLEAETASIIQLIETIPPREELEELLKIVHGKISIEDIGLSSALKTPSVQLSPYIKNRLTFARILKFYDFYDIVIQ